ncbi:MAG: hypothetical protein QM736_07600 [Vicinamibacterales bacterium]
MWRLPSGYSREQLERYRELRRAFFTSDVTRHRISAAPALRAFAAEWFDDEPAIMIGMSHLYALGSHIHTDTLNTASTDDWAHTVRFWCALEDIDPRSGPIRFYAGTHRIITATIREENPDGAPRLPGHVDPAHARTLRGGVPGAVH